MSQEIEFVSLVRRFQTIFSEITKDRPSRSAVDKATLKPDWI